MHLHQPDHAAVSAYLHLRDWLRVDADDRAFSERTKRLLATRTWTDMHAYADAKTDVVLAILGRARAWRAPQGSTTTRVPSPEPWADDDRSRHLLFRVLRTPVAGLTGGLA